MGADGDTFLLAHVAASLRLSAPWLRSRYSAGVGGSMASTSKAEDDGFVGLSCGDEGRREASSVMAGRWECVVCG